jgi:ankyrin repeat protein
MKKTILTLSMVVLAMGTGLMAKEITGTTRTANEKSLSEIEISSFCKAVIQGDVTTVKRLIALGEDVDQKSLGMTPAMFAARYNKVEVLSILIEHGADLEMKSNQGFSVKKYAELSNATAALAVIETALGI